MVPWACLKMEWKASILEGDKFSTPKLWGGHMGPIFKGGPLVLTFTHHYLDFKKTFLGDGIKNWTTPSS